MMMIAFVISFVGMVFFYIRLQNSRAENIELLSKMIVMEKRIKELEAQNA